jgi:hypothetical protein
MQAYDVTLSLCHGCGSLLVSLGRVDSRLVAALDWLIVDAGDAIATLRYYFFSNVILLLFSYLFS